MKLMLLILSINQGKEKRASSKLSAVQPYGVHFKRDLFSWFVSSVEQEGISSSLWSGWEAKTLIGYVSIIVQSCSAES